MLRDLDRLAPVRRSESVSRRRCLSLMQLKTLLAATPVRQVFGSVDRPVENVAYDSRRVQRHTMFVALRGEKADGHQFIGHAIDKGASVIVAEREQKDSRVTCPLVK